MCNSIRGFLAEYGIIINQGRRILSKNLTTVMEEEREKLMDVVYEHLMELKQELDAFAMRLSNLEKKIERLSQQSDNYRKLLQIDGVGPITASAVIASAPAASNFKNGRHFAAWLGLVPKQHSTGGKTRLLGISKRGDSYLRSLLIQGARVSLMFSKGKDDRRNIWASELSQRRGKQKACAALANKNARTIWAMIAYGTEFNRDHGKEHYRLAA